MDEEMKYLLSFGAVQQVSARSDVGRVLAPGDELERQLTARRRDAVRVGPVGRRDAVDGAVGRAGVGRRARRRVPPVALVTVGRSAYLRCESSDTFLLLGSRTKFASAIFSMFGFVGNWVTSPSRKSFPCQGLAGQFYYSNSRPWHLLWQSWWQNSQQILIIDCSYFIASILSIVFSLQISLSSKMMICWE